MGVKVEHELGVYIFIQDLVHFTYTQYLWIHIPFPLLLFILFQDNVFVFLFFFKILFFF